MINNQKKKKNNQSPSGRLDRKYGLAAVWKGSAKALVETILVMKREVMKSCLEKIMVMYTRPPPPLCQNMYIIWQKMAE